MLYTITSEHDPVRGGITCATVAYGRRISERYYGYTMREARAAFRQYLATIAN